MLLNLVDKMEQEVENINNKISLYNKEKKNLLEHDTKQIKELKEIIKII